MTKAIVTVGACAALLWTGAALATPTAQQSCNNARSTAWKVYQTCVDGVVTKDAKGVTFDKFKAFWVCRDTYFKKWATFQTTASLLGSTCRAVSNRFTVTDSGATVTDGLTGLVWELKTNNGVHDGSNFYSWSTGSFGSTAEDGTAFTSFLTDPATGLNVTGFAGANGWRLPTLTELQTILADFPCTGAGDSATCTCSPGPCIAFSDPNTQSDVYWSATRYVPNPNHAWDVDFGNGGVYEDYKTVFIFYVRAVRGSL